MRYITSMDIKIFTIDVAGQCEVGKMIFPKSAQKRV